MISRNVKCPLQVVIISSVGLKRSRVTVMWIQLTPTNNCPKSSSWWNTQSTLLQPTSVTANNLYNLYKYSLILSYNHSLSRYNKGVVSCVPCYLLPKDLEWVKAFAITAV